MRILIKLNWFARRVARHLVQHGCPAIFILMRLVFGTAFWVVLITAIKWHLLFPLNWWTIAAYATAVLFGVASQKLRC